MLWLLAVYRFDIDMPFAGSAAYSDCIHSCIGSAASVFAADWIMGKIYSNWISLIAVVCYLKT